MTWFESVKEHLALFWMRLTLLWGQARDLPQKTWAQTEGQLGTRFFIILTAVGLAAAVIAFLIHFFKGNWKTKLNMLLTLVIVVLALGVLLYFALDSFEDKLPPEAETVSIGSEQVQLYPQYSLARGSLQDEPDRYWHIIDDSVSWQVSEGMAIQLNGLQSMPEHMRYTVNGLANYGDSANINLSGGSSIIDPSSEYALYSTNRYLELVILPGQALADQIWYQEAGASVEEDDAVYTVLEQTEDSLLFVISDSWTDWLGQPLPGLAMARQVGDDTVYAVLRAFVYKSKMYGVDPMVEQNDPLNDEALRDQLLSVLQSFFDEHLLLLKDLSKEEMAAVLPDKLVDYPLAGSAADGGFSLPCTRLLSFGYNEEGRPYLQLLGDGPEGDETLYTLYNGALLLHSDYEADYTAWSAAFERGAAHPDETMSDYLGGTAVPYRGGWLLHPGSFMEGNTTYEIYYFLAAESAAEAAA